MDTVYFLYKDTDNEGWEYPAQIKLSFSGKYLQHKVPDKKHSERRRDLKALRIQKRYFKEILTELLRANSKVFVSIVQLLFISIITYLNQLQMINVNWIDVIHVNIKFLFCIDWHIHEYKGKFIWNKVYIGNSLQQLC